MEKTSESAATKQGDPINLKHRITGAGVLIFFGALVLPWLLGPPSEAKKEDTIDVANASVELHSTFEDDVLSDLQGVDSDFEEPEESVYVSKITPVNAGKSEVSKPVRVDKPSDDKNSSKKNSGDPEAAKNAAVVTKSVGAPQDADSTNKKVSKNGTKDSATDSVSKVSKNKSKDASTAASKNTPKKASKDAAVAKTQKDVKKTKTSSASEPEVKASTKPKVNAPKVDVGWVVQVELLTDKSGAKRLVDELSDKGFKPHTTIVDTNRGKKTGTRIWLGPYAQRGQAGAENDKLEARMGKRGFIRVYP